MPRIMHAVVIALYLWFAIICSLMGEWKLSFIWLVGLAGYVLIISINVKPR